VSPEPRPATRPALLLEEVALRLATTGLTSSPVASRALPRRRATLPQLARTATRGKNKRAVALLLPHPTTAMGMSSGMTRKAVAFRRADRPARPVLLPVHSAHRLDGTGVAPRDAAFLPSQALLPPNAIQGGNGLRMTSASPSQPLRLLITLSLQTGMAMAGRRFVVPTSSRSLVLGIDGLDYYIIEDTLYPSLYRQYRRAPDILSEGFEHSCLLGQSLLLSDNLCLLSDNFCFDIGQFLERLPLR